VVTGIEEVDLVARDMVWSISPIKDLKASLVGPNLTWLNQIQHD
jgi:hypothetical protein